MNDSGIQIDTNDFYDVLKDTKKHSVYIFEGELSEIISKIDAMKISKRITYHCIGIIESKSRVNIKNVEQIAGIIGNKSNISKIIFGTEENSDIAENKICLKILLFS